MQTFTFLLLFSVLFAAQVLSIPKTTDVGIAPDTGPPVSSLFLKQTDEICQWLFSLWAVGRDRTTESRRSRARILRPIILSRRAARVSHSLIKFECFDNRNPSWVTRAVRQEQEVKALGPFFLLCDADTEDVVISKQSKWGDDPDHITQNNYRSIGLCVPRPAVQHTPALSVAAAAGAPACITAEIDSDLSFIDAFLSEVDKSTHTEQSRSFDWDAQWLSLQEIGTSNHNYVQNVPLVFIPINHQPGRRRVYRACGEQKAGHGNARLYLVST